MLKVLIGLFTSYRDGDDALRALQALGLNPESGHLYQESKREPSSHLYSETADPYLHLEERAECAAHGEYLNVSGAANRYSAESDHGQLPTDAASPASGSATARTLLVIEDIGGLRPATACGVLYDYGAVAVKDPSGHWRFSPHRNVCRSQE
jgi:hypothetical protein